MAITILDVARLANVSAGTASQVLRGRAVAITVSDATRERILAAAKSLDYVPDSRARLLRRQKSSVVGILTRFLRGSFRPEILNALNVMNGVRKLT